MARFVPRKSLPHEIPGWVSDGALFFLTICAAARGSNTLATSSIAPALIESVRFRHEQRTWFVRLFLVMPDHVHGLVALSPGLELEKEVESWKRYMSRQAGVRWQKGFFDHRLRSGESFAEKARYIRENPVRAGLAATAEEWPWVFVREQVAYLE